MRESPFCEQSYFFKGHARKLMQITGLYPEEGNIAETSVETLLTASINL